MLTIKTNNHLHEWKHRGEVPSKILSNELDWTTEEEDTDGYFSYRGIWYHLSQFMRFNYGGGDAPKDFKGWHAYLNDSAFSGVVIAVNDDGQYKVGTFYSHYS